jgi:hypothetical protein
MLPIPACNACSPLRVSSTAASCTVDEGDPELLYRFAGS